MPRNVEIKARVADMADLRERVVTVADSGPVDLEQEDVFFGCPTGRLKLRKPGNGESELIFYSRADSAGPKISEFFRSPCREPAALERTLAKALGVIGVVRKHREVYLAGPTRIHLDRVEGLGDFLELEVVLEPDEEPEDGERAAHELMRSLGVESDQLVAVAYLDLLATDRGRRA